MEPDMSGYRRIYRAAEGNYRVVEILNRTRKVLADSIGLLSEPAPDTFLGRRRGEIAPLPDEESESHATRH
jgi:hypothetical protein